MKKRGKFDISFCFPPIFARKIPRFLSFFLFSLLVLLFFSFGFFLLFLFCLLLFVFLGDFASLADLVVSLSSLLSNTLCILNDLKRFFSLFFILLQIPLFFVFALFVLVINIVLFFSSFFSLLSFLLFLFLLFFVSLAKVHLMHLLGTCYFILHIFLSSPQGEDL